jgi:hypothetical protein
MNREARRLKLNKLLRKAVTPVLILAPMCCLAGGLASPHVLQEGDVISADILNEITNAITELGRDIKSEDIVGTWKITNTTNTGNGMSGGLATDPSGLSKSRVDQITFADDGDGTFSWSQVNYSSFMRFCGSINANCTQPGAGNYAVSGGLGLFEDTNNYAGDVGRWSVSSRGKNQFIFVNGIETNNTDFYMVKIDRLNLPPNKPEALTASINGLSVTLNWLDKSSDEIDFKILRRDPPDSTTGIYPAYKEIETVAAGSTGSVNVVPANGQYWFRVLSTNANGDSVGSNVAEVLIQ